MIKYVLIIGTIILGSLNTANAQDVWIAYNVVAQPVATPVYVPVTTVTYVPVMMQKELVVNTWGFRPILTPNFVYYQTYPVSYPLYSYNSAPCLFRPYTWRIYR